MTTAQVGLSGRQMAILRFLRAYARQHSYGPSIRDIQDACDISSTSVVDYNLHALERRGYIRRERGISRAIEVVGVRRMRSVPIIGFLQDGGFLPLWAVGR